MAAQKIATAVLEIRTDTGSFMSDVDKVEKRGQSLASVFKSLGGFFESFGKNVEDAGKAIEKTTRSTDSFGTSFGKLVGSFLTAQAIIGAVRAGFDAIAGGITGSIKAAGDAEKAHVQLVAALRAQGTSIPSVISAYTGYATALQKTTIYQDDAIEGAAALLVQIGNVMPRDMEKALKATTNLASGLGIDLDTAVRLVAKSAEGNTAALKKAGVVIDETTAKSGDFGKILDKINEKFAGQAEAIAGTYQGRLTQLGNTWNNVEEAIGRVITQNATVLAAMNRVNQPINDETGELNDNATANDLVSAAVIGAVKAMAGLVEAGGFVAKEFIAVYKIGADVIQIFELLNLTAAKFERLRLKSTDVFGMDPKTQQMIKDVDRDISAMTASIDARSKSLKAADAAQDSIDAKTSGYAKRLNELAVSLEQTRGKTVARKDVTDGAANACDRQTKGVHQLTEEEKKFAAAMIEMNAVGVGWQGTLDTVDGTVVEAVKYYIQAGVSLGALAAAYHLTEAQVKSIDASWKQEAETIKILDAARAEAGKTALAWIEKESKATREYLDDRVKAYGEALDAARSTENEMALLGVSGAMRAQRALDQKEQAELSGLAHLRVAYPEIYGQIADAIHQKYQMMAADSVDAIKDIIDVGHDLGLSTKEEITDNLERARETYRQLKESGSYDVLELRKAWLKLQDAETAARLGVQSWGTVAEDVLSRIPSIVVQAFTSGGGVVGALAGVGTMAASALGKNIGAGIKSLGKIGGPLGEAIGSLAGPLIQWIAGLFDHVPSDLRKKARDYGVTLSDEVMQG